MRTSLIFGGIPPRARSELSGSPEPIKPSPSEGCAHQKNKLSTRISLFHDARMLGFFRSDATGSDRQTYATIPETQCRAIEPSNAGRLGSTMAGIHAICSVHLRFVGVIFHVRWQ
jgi:hypothetical protein